MPTKEELHRLVENLPNNELHAARRFLEYLCELNSDPVLRALGQAPEDKEPLSHEEAVESEAAWRAYQEGIATGERLEKVRRKLS